MQNEDAFSHNHQTLLSLMRGAEQDTGPDRRMSIRLERVLADNATGDIAPFDGKAGIEALLSRIAAMTSGTVKETHDGRLMGLAYSLAVGKSSLQVSVSLGPGAQVICTVGPTASIALLLVGLEDFDRRIHVAGRDLGKDYLLIAEGYNPFAASPLDIPLIPRTQWTLLNAYLGQTGRYARDMMRCGCATEILLERGDTHTSVNEFRLATALTPLIMFLTDNVRSFRASGARRCPRMVRSILWDEVDPARCGIVPGTYDSDFSFDDYASWLEGIDPILLVDSVGTVASTGKRTMREVMGERILAGGELLSLTEAVYPYVRLGRDMELLQADSLRPTMACGYAAFIKGTVCNGLSCEAALSLLGTVSERDVAAATHELRTRGWDANVYGMRATDLVEQLLQIARTALDNAEERRILDNIAELWDVRMVPRDTFVRQEEKADRGW